MKYIILLIALLLAFILSGCSTTKEVNPSPTYKLPPQHEAMHRKMMSEQYKFIQQDNQ